MLIIITTKIHLQKLFQATSIHVGLEHGDYFAKYRLLGYDTE
jgi:hypothetical protein